MTTLKTLKEKRIKAFIVSAILLLLGVGICMWEDYARYRCYGMSDETAIDIAKKSMLRKYPLTKAWREFELNSVKILRVQEYLKPNDQRDNAGYYSKIVYFSGGDLKIKSTIYSDCGVEWSW